MIGIVKNSKKVTKAGSFVSSWQKIFIWHIYMPLSITHTLSLSLSLLAGLHLVLANTYSFYLSVGLHFALTLTHIYPPSLSLSLPESQIQIDFFSLLCRLDSSDQHFVALM
jgi:hypothetical protein